MTDLDRVKQAALDVAAAIERRDVEALAAALAPGFLYRSPGSETRTREAFLEGVSGIPGEILFVRLETIDVDLSEAAALVSGIQHARVRIDGKEIDDRRAFVDWFVRVGPEWKIRAAIDLPLVEETPARPS
jgi:ketosteroid isomerase-like protein